MCKTEEISDTQVILQMYESLELENIEIIHKGILDIIELHFQAVLHSFSHLKIGLFLSQKREIIEL